jgi:NADH-quinone oxidoreductase subunit L
MTAVQLGAIAVLTPLFVAVLLLVVAPLRKSGRWAAWLSVAGALASFGASVAMLVQRVADPSYGASLVYQWIPAAGTTVAAVGLELDGVSISMLAIVSLVALCVQVFSLEYLSEESPKSFGRYFAYQSLFLFSMQGLVAAPNMLHLFLCWELVGLCSYLLIGYWYRKPSAARAAVKAFWVTKFADIGLVVGLILQFTAVHSFGWDPESVAALERAGAVLPWVAGLYFMGVMGKSAQFPLHIWLPDAMEGPTPVSALLHAATMVAAGVYLVVRAFPIFAAAESVLPIISVIGGFTALFAAIIAVVQTDIKRVLAYSTCSQLGYMIAALGAGNVFAGYFHLGTHAFFKALLFLAAGSAIHAVHSNEIFDMGGLRKKMPFTTVVFVIGAAALAGIPLFSGFFSKDQILEALMEGTHHNPLYWFSFLACLVTVGLTAYYMSRVVFIAFFGEPSSEKAAHAHEGGWAMVVPLTALALGSVFVGYAGGHLVVLTETHHELHFSVTHLTAVGGIGILLALFGIGVSWQIDLRGTGQGLKTALAPVGDFIRYGAVDRVWVFVYRQLVEVLSTAISWFDRYVVDGVMNAVAGTSILLGERIRAMQTGRVNDYVLAVILGVILLATWSQVFASVGS